MLFPTGEMARRIHAHDWAATPLGAMSEWPVHLRCAVQLMLGHGFPMIVLWGPELIQLYNDGYAEVMRSKHPAGLGQATAHCWPEVWHINGPIYARVQQGDTVTYADKRFPLERDGVPEDSWFTITYSPIRDDSGSVDGVLVTMFDTTAGHLEYEGRLLAQAGERESRQQLDLALQLMPVGIAVVDRAGKARMTNERMREYMPGGLVPSQDPDLSGRWQGWDEAGHALPATRYPTARALGGEVVLPGLELLFTTEDGRKVWTQVASAPLRDTAGRITGAFSMVMDIDGLKRSSEEARLAKEHQQVLLAELQHRVRNTMAIIRSMAARTAAGAGTVSEYAALLEGRLLTLARVQTLLTRYAGAGIRLSDLMASELAAQADDPSQYQLAGLDVALAPRQAEVLTLAIHELVTNAVKHGALSAGTGRVQVRWRVAHRRGERWLFLVWRESGRHHRRLPDTLRRGFGTELIEDRIPYELRGRGHLVVTSAGVRCRLSFPLGQAASLLETDARSAAPVPEAVAAGRSFPGLRGARVLVAEDDFYLASDVVRMLETAGAHVMGPCCTTAACRALLSGKLPEVALMDINLNGVETFALARFLVQQGVRVVFVSGYDPELVPGDLAGVPHLQKPVAFAELLHVIERMLA